MRPVDDFDPSAADDTSMPSRRPSDANAATTWGNAVR